MADPTATLSLLGHAADLPASPEAARLERVPNPEPEATYLVRFACPEFTSLCPVTGQPDFAHLVIDYAPGQWLVESKSLKLFLGSFRNHGGFHEGCTLMVGQAHRRRHRAALAADRRLLVSARRHADRRLLADRRAARGAVAARPGRAALSGPLIIRVRSLGEPPRRDHPDRQHRHERREDPETRRAGRRHRDAVGEAGSICGNA